MAREVSGQKARKTRLSLGLSRFVIRNFFSVLCNYNHGLPLSRFPRFFLPLGRDAFSISSSTRSARDQAAWVEQFEASRERFRRSLALFFFLPNSYVATEFDGTFVSINYALPSQRVTATCTSLLNCNFRTSQRSAMIEAMQFLNFTNFTKFLAKLLRTFSRTRRFKS